MLARSGNELVIIYTDKSEMGYTDYALVYIGNVAISHQEEMSWLLVQ